MAITAKACGLQVSLTKGELSINNSSICKLKQYILRKITVPALYRQCWGTYPSYIIRTVSVYEKFRRYRVGDFKKKLNASDNGKVADPCFSVSCKCRSSEEFKQLTTICGMPHRY